MLNKLLQLSSRNTKFTQFIRNNKVITFPLMILIIFAGALTYTNQYNLQGQQSKAAPTSWKVLIVAYPESALTSANNAKTQVVNFFSRLPGNFNITVDVRLSNAPVCHPSGMTQTGISIAGYDTLTFYMPPTPNTPSPCAKWGTVSVSPWAHVVNVSNLNPQTIVHEVGHYAFGLEHAGMFCSINRRQGSQDYACNSTDDPPATNSPQTVSINGVAIPNVITPKSTRYISEYGDTNTVMGIAPITGKYSNLEMKKIGWPISTIIANSSQNYSLSSTAVLEVSPYFVEIAGASVIIREACLNHAWDGAASERRDSFCAVTSLGTNGTFNGSGKWIKNLGNGLVYIGTTQASYPGNASTGNDTGDTDSVPTAGITINGSSANQNFTTSPATFTLRWSCSVGTAQLQEAGGNFYTPTGTSAFKSISRTTTYTIKCANGTKTSQKSITAAISPGGNTGSAPPNNTTQLQGRIKTNSTDQTQFSDGPLTTVSGKNLEFKWTCPQTTSTIKIENASGTVIHQANTANGTTTKLLTNSGPVNSIRNYYLRCQRPGTSRTSDGLLRVPVQPQS